LIKRGAAGFLLLGLSACGAGQGTAPIAAAPATPLVAPQGLAVGSGETVDRIFGVHRDLLEQLDSKPPSQLFAACVRPWHLGGYITDLAVTVQGVLGVLVGSGTAAAEAHWMPAHQKPDHAALKEGSIHIQAGAGSSELARLLEPSLQAAIASRRVQPAGEGKIRSALLESAQTVQAVAVTLSSLELHGTRWKADNFRLEVSFDANGNPVPMLNVGSGVTFRFDWDLKKAAHVESTELAVRAADESAGSGAAPGGRLADKVRGFISAVSRDLDVLEADTDAVERHGFKLSEIRVGAGLTAGAGGSFGFPEASTQMVGSFTFHPQLPASGDSAGIRAPASLDEQDGTLGQVRGVRIKRSLFRKGLARANRIASFFVSHAAGLRVGRWGIGELHTEFDLSLGGGLAIATVGGTGVVELTYENQKL